MVWLEISALFVASWHGTIRSAVAAKTFKITSRRGQEIVMVLYALREMGSIHTKQEVLSFIRIHRLYAIQSDDKHSYEGKNEWKSDTLLCWGRKDAVDEERAWMFHHDEKDSWQLARPGFAALEKIFANFRSKKWQIKWCYMWRPEFKRIVDPDYVESSADWPRTLSRAEQYRKALEDL